MIDSNPIVDVVYHIFIFHSKIFEIHKFLFSIYVFKYDSLEINEQIQNENNKKTNLVLG